jgi:hypothetical protein
MKLFQQMMASICKSTAAWSCIISWCAVNHSFKGSRMCWKLTQTQKVNSKGKVPVHGTKVCVGSRGVIPLVLSVGTIQMWVTTSRLVRFNPWGKEPRTHSLWIKSTDALNSSFIVITILNVSGSLSAHHQEFLVVRRHWYILCKFDDYLLQGAGWNGHQICIKCTNADVRLRTSDDGQKDCPKHVES